MDIICIEFVCDVMQMRHNCGLQISVSMLETHDGWMAGSVEGEIGIGIGGGVEAASRPGS